MCLEIIAKISPDARRRVGARRLSRETGLHVSKIRFEEEPALHFAVTGGCSCEFLAEGYDPEGLTWRLDPIHIEALVKAISLLGSEAGKFSFLVHFLGAERERTSRCIGIGDLLALVRANQIGNNVLYEVV